MPCPPSGPPAPARLLVQGAILAPVEALLDECPEISNENPENAEVRAGTVCVQDGAGLLGPFADGADGLTDNQQARAHTLRLAPQD